jgi:hypothetical protein
VLHGFSEVGTSSCIGDVKLIIIFVPTPEAGQLTWFAACATRLWRNESISLGSVPVIVKRATERLLFRHE